MGDLASILKRRAPFFLTMLCLALVVGFIVYDVRARAAPPPATPPAPTVASEENGDYAHAGWTVRMVSGLEVTLAGVEKSGVTWFFHFSFANPTSKTVIARTRYANPSRQQRRPDGARSPVRRVHLFPLADTGVPSAQRADCE